MRRFISPVAILIAAVLTGLALAAIVLWTVSAQPWLGVQLVTDGDQVRVYGTHPGGPASAIPAGTVLLGISVPGGPSVTLEPGDLTEEPDSLPSFDAYDRFMERQQAVSHMMRAAPDGLVLRTDSGDLTLRPAAKRPVDDLPLAFWVQMGVALCGFWIGAWVYALRRGGRAEAFLLLAGVGLMLSAMAAAVYSSRELAIPPAQFRVLQTFNHFGALTFGVGMIALFLSYPVRLVRSGWLYVPAVILLGWWALNELRLWPVPVIGFQMPVALAMLAICIEVGFQRRATRRDPRARAALRWFGLSVMIGAGAFVLTIILPRLIGAAPVLSQGYAFLFFLLIYVGLALGVSRYRLFELEDWAFRILFTMGGVALLLALDALLIYAVSLDRIPAFGLSLIAVALLYLPLRESLARRLLGQGKHDRDSQFRDVSDVAFAPPGTNQRKRWEDLLRAEFDPLQLEPVPSGDRAALVTARLTDDGMTLDLPGIDTLAPVRLIWAHGGRRLFSARDLARASELCAMLRHTTASRRAYETGVAEERARIAQDMHDNIGIQLMGALHSANPERKDALIRETLTDLRDIISNADRRELTLEETFADLRAEISEHLSAAGIALNWVADGRAESALRPRLAHTLRSVLREAAGNILRHSGALQARVLVSVGPGALRVEVQDDGCGFDPDTLRVGGQGLSNMRARVTGLGGVIDFSRPAIGGTLMRATIPLTEPEEAAA